ncbi:MAG: Na+/H+ antiporter NhaA [Desulfobacteraceae bacterium]|nr:Na+/H+ antiporter NhaA [Desulfobacteraceae bacterium]MBC2756023.1 Na+/H+ antiporter NhaA [Desulfobacteraceae bacterium]
MKVIQKYRSAIHGVFSGQIVKPAQRFFRKEAASSLLLLAATITALIWANFSVFEFYHHIWHTEIGFTIGQTTITKSLIHWINDGLMALFFFTVGLEIKRELLVGELSLPQKALFPVAAAVGGMLVPGIIFALINFNTPSAGGWAIPMATDIAFAMGAIAIFGKKLPMGLRVFLAAFAIADDLGAVFIIALFYTKEIVFSNIVICGILVLMLALANFLWIRWTIVYAVLGLLIWIAVLGSGLHPTIAGIIVSMFIPAQGKYDTDLFVQKARQRLDAFECAESSCGFSILLNEDHLNAVQRLELDCHNVETPLQRMLHALHPWVAFLILPVFALGNAGLSFHDVNFSEAMTHPLTLGIILGLFLGKPIGITLFSYLAVKTRIAVLPQGIHWQHIIGASMFGGIGFTMSLFVSGLSFTDPGLINYSKFAILAGSVISAAAGIIFLLAYTFKIKS